MTTRSPKGQFKHGQSGYVNYRCRCDICTEGNRQAMRRYRARRAALSPESNPDLLHGRQATYTNHRCRCGLCTAAHTAHRREWAARRRESNAVT